MSHRGDARSSPVDHRAPAFGLLRKLGRPPEARGRRAQLKALPIVHVSCERRRRALVRQDPAHRQPVGTEPEFARLAGHVRALRHAATTVEHAAPVSLLKPLLDGVISDEFKEVGEYVGEDEYITTPFVVCGDNSLPAERGDRSAADDVALPAAVPAAMTAARSGSSNPGGRPANASCPRLSGSRRSWPEPERCSPYLEARARARKRR
jgi:hypothetical protein